MKAKYPISKEFFPFNKFVAPRSRFILFLARIFLKTPSFVFKTKDIQTTTHKIDGYNGNKVTLYMFLPKSNPNTDKAIIFIHGGGFIFEGFSSHYKIAMEYARRCNCKVIYVKYNLAPKNPFPSPQYDCYYSYRYIFDHAEELGINTNKIGITGDSAGGTLALTSMLIAKEEGFSHYPLFQILIYPWLDNRNNSESNKLYTDTPMWNSTLSKTTSKYTNKKGKKFPPHIISPIEYKDLSFLPPAYIEVAQYDCLRDDGILYAKKLKENNIDVILHLLENAMHGYETKYNAPKTREMIEKRIAYINEIFEKNNKKQS